MATISVLSTVFIKSRVTATVAGTHYNPTNDVVQAAFVAPGVTPVLGDWKPSSWESSGTAYFARCLVGPAGTVTLAVGTYDVWLKITDNPEIPVLEIGTLRVH